MSDFQLSVDSVGCVSYLHDLVVYLGVKNPRDEASADALDLVWAGLATGQDPRLSRLNSNDQHIFVHRFQVLSSACMQWWSVGMLADVGK